MKYLMSVLFAVASVAFADDGFKAELVEVKIYKGDVEKPVNGSKTACEVGLIVVQEIYKLSNTTLDDIVMAHWTTAAPSYGGLSIHQQKWKIKDSDYLELSYCQQKGMKADIETRFMNSAGKTSNIVKFSVDTDSLTLHEPSEFTPLVKIQ